YVQPDPHGDLRSERVGREAAGDRDERVVEIGALQQEVVREATVCSDQRQAGGEARSGETDEPGGIEEDRGAVGTGARRRDAPACHRAAIVLIDAEALRGQERREAEG